MSSELPVVAFRRIRRALMSIHLYAAAMTLWLCILPVAAQSAYFRGVTETLPGSYTHPSDIAVDGKGNIYVADAGANTVSEILASNGSQVTLASGFNFPLGLALDSSGNVYVADYANGAVKEILASNESVTTLASGYDPQGVAVDSSGNVYFSDYVKSNVYEILAVDGSIPVSPTINIVGGGFSGPEGLAIDNQGNIYIADVGHGAVKEMQNTCSSSGCVTTLASGLNAPEGVAVDNSGNVFVSNTGGNTFLEILAVDGSIPASPTIIALGSGFNHPIGVAVDATGDVFVANYGGPSVLKVITGGVNFGSAPVGTTSTSSPITFQFTFTAGGTIKAPVVLTLGATGLDFTDTGSGTCTTNGTSYAYVSGNTCTVTVKFAPKAPGLRLGAVQLENASGNPIATARLYGTGSGPQAVFPGNSTPAVVGSGFSFPTSVAVDGSGNVFVADNGNVAVKEIVAVGGKVSSSSTVNTVGSGLIGPIGVAADGSGDVFVADFAGNAVDEIVAVSGQVSSSSTVITVGSGFNGPAGVAVDASGDVFVADNGNNTVKEIVAVNGQVSASSTVIMVGSGFNGPAGVAVDASGDVFVADEGNSAVKEIVAVNGQVSSSSTVNTVGSGFNQPIGVAVDASGDVFVADNGNNAVKEIVAVNGQVSSGSTVITVGTGFSAPYGVAVDASGNVFVADRPGNAVKEIPLATPPTITFPAVTQQGTTDTVDGPLSATVANNGNATLTFNLPTTGDNPSLSTSNFTWDDLSSTCTQTTPSSSTAFTLAEGASCTVAVEFTPTATGTLSDNLSLTDDSLNAAAATQQIPLSGTAVDITMTPAANTVLPSGSVGTAYSGTTFAASGGSGSYTYSATGLPAGLTLDSSSGALSGTPTAVANSASVTVTVTDSSSSVQVSQNYTITISQGTVTLSWTPPSSITYGTNLSTVLTATASVGGTTEPPSFGAATYTASLNPSGTPFAVNNSTVLDAGAYTLTLSYTPGDTTDYTTPAQVQVTLTVNQATATISINNIPASPVYNGSFTPAYAYSGNGSPTESVSSTTPGVCTVSSGVVNFGGVGTCTLTAAATATTDYAAATGTPQSFTVGQATATISINNIPSSPVYNGSFTPAYAYSGNGSPTESVSSTTPGVCTVSSGVVNFGGVGTCTLTAAATATTDYAAATGTPQSFTVGQATATISINNIPASPVYNGSFTPAYAYSGNGSPTESVSSTTPGVCTVSSGVVNFGGVGTCTLTAAATATTDYAAAAGTPQSFTVGQATATISINNIPASPVYNGSFTPAYAYSGNGSPTESVSSTTPGVCTVSSGVVNFGGVGTCTLTAAATATTDYAAATGTPQSFTVGQATATISINNIPASPVYNGSFTPAYAYSGNGSPTESVSSTTPGVCTVSSGVVNFGGVGTCTLTAAATATTDYAAAAGTPQSFTVGQATATISINNIPASPVYNGSFTPAYAYSGNGSPTESVSSTTPGVCTVSSGVVNFGGVGTCTLTAAATATTDYAAATGTPQSFTVGQATATISINNIPASPVYNGSFTPAYAYSGNGSPTESVSSTTPGVCTVSSGVVNFGGVGTCTLTAAATATTDYAAATGTPQSFTVGQATATISINNIPSSPVYNGSFTPAYAYSGNGSPTESVSSTTPGVCTVSSGVVNFGGVGTCTLTAAATATTDYAAATGTPQSFTVGQATATISINNIPASPVYNGSFTPAYAYSGNGSPTESVSSTTPGVCTVSSGVVNFGGVGTCTLTAAATATTDYAAAAGTPQSFTVGQATATISINNIPASPVYNGSFTPAYAYSGNGSPTESVSSTTPGVCTVSSGVVNFGGVGTCTLTAAATATTDYAAATGTPQSFTVGQATATISINNIPASPVYNGSFTPAYAYSGNGSPTESVSSTTPGVCTVSSGVVNFGGVGTCTLTAAATATTDYAAAAGTPQSFTVGQATATISINNIPASPVYNGSFTPAYAYSGNGSPTESVSSTTPGVCTVSSGVVNFGGVGTCTLTAAATATTDYAAATGTPQSFTVGQATATISINNIPASPVYNGSFTPAYAYSGNGSPTESVSSTTPGVCTVSSGVVNFGGVGTCTLTAAATATTDYAAATGTPQSFTVGQATATIGVNNIPASPVYNGSFTPAYTYSGNGSPTESVSSTTPGVCTVSSGVVNFGGVGTCTLTAAATATTDYAAATGTPQSFTVGQATATISINNIPASPVYNGSFTPAYTYSGNGSPTESVSSTTPGVCTVSSGVVNFGGVGTCTLTAAATATTDYAAATGTPQSFTVGQATAMVTWTPAATISYGTSLAGELDASAAYKGQNVAGTFSYTAQPTGGAATAVTGATILPPGGYTLATSFAPTDPTDYNTVTDSAAITVSQATLTVAANDATRVYGVANPVFTGSVTGAVNGDTFTESFLTSATIASNVGTYSIVPSAAGANLANYTVTVQNGTLTITQAGTTTSLNVSSGSITPGQSVTLTAQVASTTTGAPTGSVNFYDGATLLDTATLAGGTASFATTTLSAGTTHQLTAVYSGDTNFATSSTSLSTPTIVAALDFSVAASGTTSQTVNPGSAATYQFVVAPLYGTYAGPVTFTVTGLPPGASATFAPPSIPANGGQQTVTMTIQTATTTGALQPAPSTGRTRMPLALAFLLLPLLGVRRLRRQGQRLSRVLCLLLLLLSGAATIVLSGCGGHPASTQQPETHTLTLTASSANLQHSTTFNLTVQ